jgi:hypothetical protein
MLIIHPRASAKSAAKESVAADFADARGFKLELPVG